MTRNREILKNKNKYSCLIRTSVFVFFVFLFPGLRAQVISSHNANVSLSANVFLAGKDLNNNTGFVTNYGNINLSGSYTSTGLSQGDGFYRIGGNWIHAGTFIPSFSTVIFNGSSNQQVSHPSLSFFNLSVKNTGVVIPALNNKVIILNNIVVNNNLELESGIVDAGTFKLSLLNFLQNSLIYTKATGSRVLGRFERAVGEENKMYLFPLGTDMYYNPLNLTPNEINVSGTLISRFITGTPGSTGLPLPDPPEEIEAPFPDGYWDLKSTGFSSPDYSININAAGFSEPVTSVTRVLSRRAGDDWTVDGTHVTADTLAGVALRNNLTNDIDPAGTQYAFGRARPLIIKQIRDTIVCEDTDPYFKVVATGARTLRYTWYKVGTPDVQIPNSDPGYRGARTATLTILNAQLDDAGQYYCIITDRYGNSNRTVNATLTVKKIPEAKATPDVQNHECTDVPIDAIVLSELYGEGGTHYLWTRDNPSGITSTMPTSGTVAAIGMAIPSDSFRNSTDNPIKVTFTIYPVSPDLYPSGPACVGQPVTATITVNPVPRVVPVYPDKLLPKEICDLGTTSITLTTPTTMTRGNILFDYTVTKTGGALLIGNTTPANDLVPGHNIAFQYENNSASIQSVYYYITPKVDNAVCPPGLVVESEVKVHAVPIQGITEIQPLTCEDPSGLGALRVDIPTGGEPYSVEWTGRDNYYNNRDFSIFGLREGNYYVTVKDNLNCSQNAVKPLYAAFAEPYIYAYPINPGGYNITCRDSSDARITIAVSGGITEPYTYRFLKNGVIQDVGVFLRNKDDDPTQQKTYDHLGAGTYSLIIADRNGCGRERSISIKVPPPMVASFATTNVSCKGNNNGSVTATITGGRGGPYIYQWSTTDGYIPGSTTTNRITNVSAGTYYLDVRDVLGCPARFSVRVTEPAGMALLGAVTKNISCNGFNDGKIKMNITGGTGNYNYLWTGPYGYTSTADSISGLYAGTYTCTVTDQNGCILYATPGVKPTFTLTQPLPLQISATLSRSPYGGYEIACNGQSGSADIVVTGGTAPYTYTWSTTNGSGIIAGSNHQPALKAGNYHVDARDANGCTISYDFTMNQPQKIVLQLSPTNITCVAPGLNNGRADLTVSGGTGPYTFQWSNGATTEDISGLTGGTYSVMVRDMNSCFDTASVEIHLPPTLRFSTSLSSYNSYEVSCYGMADGEIYVMPDAGNAPFLYSLSGPSGFMSVNSTGQFKGLKAGTYTVVVTDKYSCTANEVINLREPGRLEARLVTSQSIVGGFNLNCAGDSTATITVNPRNSVNNVTYLWSDGFSGRSRYNLKAGDYRVVITDDNNCQAVATTTITAPDSIHLSLQVDPPFCPDKPDGSIATIITGGIPGMQYNYLWSDKSTGDKITDIPGGYYSVVVRDLNGCVLRDSLTLYPENETCLIVPNMISPNGDLINDYWNIGEKELYPEMVITIFNRWGETIWRSERGYPNPWDGKVRGQVLPIDSYHYIIDLKNGSEPIIGNVTIVK
ncbi:MAG TPA: gliding motility-associated C-terminal domain-containing protein [Bacteroidales bacterium]|nr:gliding motility-associated C-terminal domain-containing protein [Bacteroidales bacterium]